MIKHIVMWTLREEAEGALKSENIRRLKEMLEVLPSIISEIEYFEVGLNYNASVAAFDVVLISSFTDRAALERYQKHPKHVEVGEFVSKVRDRRAVADFETG